VSLNHNYELIRNYDSVCIQMNNFVFVRHTGGFFRNMVRNIKGEDSKGRRFVEEWIKKPSVWSCDWGSYHIQFTTKRFLELEDLNFDKDCWFLRRMMYKRKVLTEEDWIILKDFLEGENFENLITSEDSITKSDWFNLDDLYIVVHDLKDNDSWKITSKIFQSKVAPVLRLKGLAVNIWEHMYTVLSFKIVYNRINWPNLVALISDITIVLSLLTNRNLFVPKFTEEDLIRFRDRERPVYYGAKKKLREAFSLKGEEFYKYWVNQLNLLVINWYGNIVGFILITVVDNFIEVWLSEKILCFWIEELNLFKFKEIKERKKKKKHFFFIIFREKFGKDLLNFSDNFHFNKVYQFCKDINNNRFFFINSLNSL